MNEDDLVCVRRAVGAYFRAASALGSASLLTRHAALLVPSAKAPSADDEPDEEFLLDQAATYRDKALLMRDSAAALLSYSERWFDDLDDVGKDLDRAIAEVAVEIEAAGDAYSEVVEAIGSASFAELDTYPQLLKELRGSAQFLNAEAATYRALAEGELEDD